MATHTSTHPRMVIHILVHGYPHTHTLTCIDTIDHTQAKAAESVKQSVYKMRAHTHTHAHALAQTDRQTDRKKDKHTHAHTHTHTHANK